jgi:hypothetical protein
MESDDNYEYWCNKLISMGIDTNIIADEPDPYNKVNYYNWSFLSGSVMRLNIDFVKLALSNDKHRTDDTVLYGLSDSPQKQGANDSRYLGNDPNHFKTVSLEYNIAMELLTRYKKPSDPQIIEKVIIIIDMLINAKIKLDLSYVNKPISYQSNSGTLLDICHKTRWNNQMVPKIIAENQTFEEYLISKGCQYKELKSNESNESDNSHN